MNFSDDLTQMIADYIAENNWILGLGGFSIVLGIAIALYSKRYAAAPKKSEKKKKIKTESDKKSKSESSTNSSKKNK